MIFENVRKAFPELDIPALGTFYSLQSGWRDIFEGNPSWRSIKRSGLFKAGRRQMNTLNTGKILCDEFAHKCFAEQVDISCSVELYNNFIRDFLNREGFWRNIPPLVSKAFAQGGCALREYIENGKVRLGYIEGQYFIPLRWNSKRILSCIFTSEEVRGDSYYTLCEYHTEDKNGNSTVELRLFKSARSGVLGDRVPLSELYPDTLDNAVYAIDVPLFQYFKPDISLSVEKYTNNVPLGQSCFETCTDTLKALDVVFDSFAREFILGKKRIIVPSSCVRTVIDPDTGNAERYFDADDEVYQALKCDEERDLRITDNTTELRISQHVDGINALLNILCFQVGLSPGALSFDTAQGVKTATEVISQESKTALTIRCNKNLLVEFIEDMCRAVLGLAVLTGELPAADYDLAVSFKDSVVIDDNTLIDNAVKLVSAGLQSKLSAIMDVKKCDEETAKKELERIKQENDITIDGGVDPSEV